jgi:hypothetical protein
MVVAMASIPPSLLHSRGGSFHGIHDVLVPGATAEVAFQTVPDFFFRRIRIAVKNLLGSHDHAWRAESALESVLIPESFLDAVKLSIRGQALNRRDIRSVRLDREHRAALDGLAVEFDGTCAAQGGFAAYVRSGQAEYFTQVVNEEHPWLHVIRVTLSIDG